MKAPSLKYLFDNKTKVNSSFVLFKKTYIKYHECFSIKQRKRIIKSIEKIRKELENE